MGTSCRRSMYNNRRHAPSIQYGHSGRTPTYDACAEENVGFLELPAELFTFFKQKYFHLERQLTEKLWLFKRGYLADVFY